MLQFLNLIKESPLVPIRKSTYCRLFDWTLEMNKLKPVPSSGMKEPWGHSLGVEWDWTGLFSHRKCRSDLTPMGLEEDPVGLAVGRWRRHHSPDAFLGGDPCSPWGERATEPVSTLPLQPGSRWAAVIPFPISTVCGLPLLLQPHFVLCSIR